MDLSCVFVTTNSFIDSCIGGIVSQTPEWTSLLKLGDLRVESSSMPTVEIPVINENTIAKYARRVNFSTYEDRYLVNFRFLKDVTEKKVRSIKGSP